MNAAAAALQRVFYVSRAAPSLDAAAVRRLLSASQINNRRQDLTGLLIYTGRHFAQVLEGHAPDVQALLQRLAQDPRHTKVRVVQQEAISQRLYDGWAMGFLETDVFDAQIEQLLQGPSPLDLMAPLLMYRLWQAQHERGTLMYET